MPSAEYEGRLFIDGEFREAKSGKRYDILSPFDDSVVGSAADAGPEDVYDAVTAARRAFDETSWGTDHKFRRHCLEQFQAGMRERIEDFRTLLTAEAGVVSAVHLTHVDYMIDGMDFWNDLTTSFEWERDLGPNEILGMLSERRVRYEPYGVVGAITPWNAPFMTAIWKVTHAMATGNTVVLKSAPDTPLTAALMAQVSQQTDIPAGVFNAVSSQDKAIAGDALTGDPRVDMFHFTGSPGVGKRIQERAAEGIRKVVLELGGKSANIVLPDADLDLGCSMVAMMCMSSSGQGCALGTRAIVHADVYDEVVQRLTAIVSSMPWGDPTDPTNMVGPIIRQEQLVRMEGLVDRAREAGAKVLVGGERGVINDKANFYKPTLIVDVDPESEIAQTEVFGPVLAVIRYEGDDEEAARIANNTRYGLAAYIQSGDEERAFRLANKLRSGTVNIGPSFYLAADSPFGGWGISGVGVEHGIEGFREYLRIKTIASPSK